MFNNGTIRLSRLNNSTKLLFKQFKSNVAYSSTLNERITHPGHSKNCTQL